MIISARLNDRVGHESELSFWLFLGKISVLFNEGQDAFVLRKQITLDLDSFDQLCAAVVARKPRDRYVRSRQQFANAFVLAKQQHSRNGRKKFLRITDREHQVLPQKIARLIQIDVRRAVIKSTRK